MTKVYAWNVIKNKNMGIDLYELFIWNTQFGQNYQCYYYWQSRNIYKNIYKMLFTLWSLSTSNINSSYKIRN